MTSCHYLPKNILFLSTQNILKSVQVFSCENVIDRRRQSYLRVHNISMNI